MRELNRLGLTGAIDAGGGFQNYPEDCQVIEELHRNGQMTVRIAYNFFTRKPKEEQEDLLRWTQTASCAQGDDYFRHNGAGEMLVFSAADFEDFRVERPDMPAEMEPEQLIRILVQNRWPWRMHVTYDATISPRNIERIAALGGGIAIQHRMAYQGEYFVERYGAQTAGHTPSIRRMPDSRGQGLGRRTEVARHGALRPVATGATQRPWGARSADRTPQGRWVSGSRAAPD